MVHKYPHEITLIPVGPLTNIALAVSKDPSIASLVKDIVIMGGSITGGNVNGAAEANIYNDPEAAQIVFNAGWMVTMVGSDVGERTLITRKYLAELAVVARTTERLHCQDCGLLFELAARRADTAGPRCMIRWQWESLSTRLWALSKKCTSMWKPKVNLPAEKPWRTAWDRTRITCCTETTTRSTGVIASETECASLPGFGCRAILEVFMSRIRGK